MADNKNPGILRNMRIKRVSLVDMGANFDAKTGDGAHIMLFKSTTRKDGPALGAVHADSPDWDLDDKDDYETELGKADLTGQSRRALPDSAFAAVWTDAQGKKHRKLPIHDAGHLAAARGRVDGANIPENVKAEARSKIDAATHKEKPVAKSFKDIIKSLLTASAEPDDTKRAAELAKIAKDANDLPDGPAAHAAPAGNETDAAKLAEMKGHHDDLGKAIASFGPGPHPPEHPIHAMKAAHQQMGAMLKSAGVDCMATPGIDPTNEVAKRGTVDAEVAKKLTDLEKRNDELMKRLDAAEDLRLDVEMSAVFKSFKATAFTAEDVAKYRQMKKVAPEAYARTMEILRASDEMLAKSALWKNLGVEAGGAAGSALAQLQAKADELVEKSTKEITPEQAFEKVCLRNPKLVAQYRAEQQ